MAFVKTTVLSTREALATGRYLGQLIPVPNARLDKVSIYLEPQIASTIIADAAIITLEVFAADISGLPTGAALASDTKTLSEITSRAFFNFEIEADVPTSSVLVLSMTGADVDNYASWRYQTADSVGQELLISLDSGSTWTQDATRKFSYVAYSYIEDVVDEDAQTATILPGTIQQVLDDTAPEFSLDTVMDRTTLQGQTVVIEFGDIVVTMVVDLSGSMTWNDNDGLRFDFLSDYIDDLESILPIGSTASYSVVKFNSRQIGRMSIGLQQDADSKDLAGVRIIRNTTHKPLNSSDGVTIYEGLVEEIFDTSLTPGQKYYYGAFTYDGEGTFSTGGRADYAQATAGPVAPYGVAGLTAEEVVILSGDDDIGQRQVNLTWRNPQGHDDVAKGYTTITLVRRDDRFPESPLDGTVLLAAEPSTTKSFLDFDPAADAINGLTYYYTIFTERSGLKCLAANARTASVAISMVDRVWEKFEPPLNVPPGLFDNTPPGDPVVTIVPGNAKILLQWTTPVGASRFKVYYNETQYPQETLGPNSLIPDYDGDVIYDGTASEFVHTGLENGQPHFYAVIALDSVGNQSNAVNPAVTRPQQGLLTVIPLENVEELAAEAYNSTTNKVQWKFPFADVTSLTVYFGDTVRAISTVTFADADTRETSAELNFIEDNRTISLYSLDEDVDSEQAIEFSRSPSTDTSITATVTTTPLVTLQNRIKDTSVEFHGSLRVTERSTGRLIQEIITDSVSVTFKNPFEIAISNEPQQLVSRRAFDSTCDETGYPQYDIETYAGVYARSGLPFYATLGAEYRGNALEEDIILSIRILDKETGLPSTLVTLPETNDQGVALITTSTVTDEVVDRSGQPTGDTLLKSLVDITLPPQEVPGDYILEVTGTYLGYTKTATLEVHFEPSLNIDVDALAFTPDGVNSVEQKAFVYFGAFDGPLSEKVPAPENTIVEWSLLLLGGTPHGKPRPFYSLDGVAGSGVKSYVRDGVARNVFFGPGSDVEPPTQVSCTDGELWGIVAKAKVLGMTGIGVGVVELLPPEHTDFNRILLRIAEDQPGGGTPTSVSTDVKFADGEDISRFEVVARPDLDVLPITDERSGLYFIDGLVNPPVSGLYAPLEDGRKVYINASVFAGEGVSRNDVIITTNMTGEDGRGGSAVATVEGGRAVFDITLNARVAGTVKQAPLKGEAGSNPVYNVENVTWQDSSVIISLSVYTVAEVDGRPVVFSGGGHNLTGSTPPVFISYKEPLA